MGKLFNSGEVLDPEKGAEHYQIASHAGSRSVLHFFLRTVGSIDFLFFVKVQKGMKTSVMWIVPACNLLLYQIFLCGVCKQLSVLACSVLGCVSV